MRPWRPWPISAVSGLQASLTDVAWPVRGPVGVRATLQPPGGGQLRLTGRVTLDPIAAELRVAATGAELAPYQPYLPTTARISGAADVDAAVSIPSLAERRATVRGSAGLSRVEVRDGERTVARVERATATGLELDWPERVAVGPSRGGPPVAPARTRQPRGSPAAHAPRSAGAGGRRGFVRRRPRAGRRLPSPSRAWPSTTAGSASWTARSRRRSPSTFSRPRSGWKALDAAGQAGATGPDRAGRCRRSTWRCAALSDLWPVPCCST